MIAAIDLLFKGYRKQVLYLLLLHPQESYHVREIARLTSTVAGTLHKELSKLADAGLLHKQLVGNQLFYQANTRSDIYPELLALLKVATTSEVGNLSDSSSGIKSDVLQRAPIIQSVTREESYQSLAACVEQIESYIDNKIQFYHSRLVQDAVVKNLLEIASIISQLPEPLPAVLSLVKKTVNDSGWSLTSEEIWQIVSNQLPELKQALRQ